MRDPDVTSEGDSFCLHLCVKQGVQLLPEGVHIVGCFIQIYLAAFNPGHFQHVVNEGQQEIVGRFDLSDVAARQFFVIQMLFQQIR